jgi:iron complex transport system substrate-binding protein
MSLTRRTLLAGAAMLVAARRARAAEVVDAAGRAIPIPGTVARVFAAGPPAAILTYTLAPDILIGWPRANRPEECEFMLPEVCARPEVGRVTGRGNTANPR